MDLYDAVTLAAKQPARPANSRLGAQYWMFGAPGSAACQAAAKANGTAPSAGQHCLFSGPGDNRADLLAGVGAGVDAAEGDIVVVPRGTVVLQAIPANFSKPTPIGDPTAQFYVLKDNIALRGSDITNPQQSTDLNAGQPDVTFGFSGKGRAAFQDVTAAIARRGELVSGLGQTAQPAFRDRARQPADHGPVHQLQAVPGRDQRRQRRRHQRAASRSGPLRTSPTSCAWERCRSASRQRGERVHHHDRGQHAHHPDDAERSGRGRSARPGRRRPRRSPASRSPCSRGSSCGSRSG